VEAPKNEELIARVGEKRLILDDGTCIRADVLIASVGVRPSTGLAVHAGLGVNDGLLVNKYMETSIADIYACGDCAEFGGASAGSWARSQAQGYVAGANAAGDVLEYTEAPNPTMLRIADTCLFSIGDMGKKPGKKYEYQTERGDPRQKPGSSHFLINERPYGKEFFESWCYSDGVLVGATLIGDLTKMQHAKDAVAVGPRAV
jgi:NAD(P)H-nitrite reductase large subunit